MLIGMPTESKTEILLKNGVILDRVHTGVSIIVDMADVAVDTDETEKIGVLTEEVTDTSVLKIEELTEVDVDKIVEQTEVLTECTGASSVAEEVTISSVDEVLNTSTIESCSWEVLGVELAISPVEADSTNVIVFGGE